MRTEKLFRWIFIEHFSNLTNVCSLSIRIHFQGHNFTMIRAYLNDTNISYKIYRPIKGDTFTANPKYLSTDHASRQWLPSKPLVNSRALHAESNRESFTSFTLGGRLRATYFPARPSLSYSSGAMSYTLKDRWSVLQEVCLSCQRAGLPVHTARLEWSTGKTFW
jgi:hypothetical protein